MRIKLTPILVFVATFHMFGCNLSPSTDKPKFTLAKDYAHFSTKMRNKDTLYIGVGLSMCKWFEDDLLQITKENDSVYIQILQKNVMDDDPMSFKRVLYDLQNDSLSLEKMISEFDINDQKKTNRPFFIIINPIENDTIILRTTNLEHRGYSIARYNKIMTKLYPQEMADYRKMYFTPPPPPPIELMKK